LRTHVPLVVAGATMLNPYEGFATEISNDPADVVAACERAAAAPLRAHTDRALRTITTVFEKSLGGVAKGGTTPMMDVFMYGEPITTRGFVFMDTPGHDPVSITGLVAGGCNVICFTTGRGSVFGCKPVPSIKLATNSLMYRHMEEDMDINCGVILEGTPLPEVGRRIFEEIVAVASGKRTKSELSGVGEEEFAPWIIGPVM
jgi:altronate hydrolase